MVYQYCTVGYLSQQVALIIIIIFFAKYTAWHRDTGILQYEFIQSMFEAICHVFLIFVRFVQRRKKGILFVNGKIFLLLLFVSKNINTRKSVCLWVIMSYVGITHDSFRWNPISLHEVIITL